MAIELMLLSPSRLVLQAKVDSIRLKAELGEMELLSNHQAAFGRLSPGILSVRKEGTLQVDHFFVDSGFFSIVQNKAKILAEVLEMRGEVDSQRVDLACERAQKRLSSRGEDIEIARALAALERAKARAKLLSLKH